MPVLVGSTESETDFVFCDFDTKFGGVPTIQTSRGLSKCRLVALSWPMDFKDFLTTSVSFGIPFFRSIVVHRAAFFAIFSEFFRGRLSPLPFVFVVGARRFRNNDLLELSTGLKCCRYKQNMSFPWIFRIRILPWF